MRPFHPGTQNLRQNGRYCSSLARRSLGYRQARARGSLTPKLDNVANWFSRTARRVEPPRLRSRSDERATTRVELVEFTPDLLSFLGRSAYVQLMLFENLSRAIVNAPTTSAKTSIGRVAQLSLGKHRRLVDEIVRADGVPAEVMEPFSKPIDEFERVTRGADWYEIVTTCYVTAGFLDDFFTRLALGLPAETARRISGILSGESGQQALRDVLVTATAENDRLAPRLAMWGRRLVGDTMLLARSALRYTENHRSDAARIEPVFTELIAEHTKRMDALGLAA